MPSKPPVVADKWTLERSDHRSNKFRVTLWGFDSDDAASVGKPSQILPTCGEVATHGVDGGGWQFTRGGMRALTPPSTTLCVVPLPVNGED